MRECPFCAEQIPSDGQWCPYCRSDVTERSTPVAPPQQLSIDSTFAWALTAVPLLGLAVALIWPMVPYWALVGVGAVVNAAFGIADERRLAAAGYDPPSSFWAFLFVPVYLWLRARRVGQPAVGLVWLAVAIIAVVGWETIGPVTIDTAKAETAIAIGIQKQTGQEATVTCPGREVLRVHDTFTCTATNNAGQELTILVEVTGRDGTIRWNQVP